MELDDVYFERVRAYVFSERVNSVHHALHLDRAFMNPGRRYG